MGVANPRLLRYVLKWGGYGRVVEFMDQIIKYVFGEMRTIADAPIVFCTALLVVAGIIWWAMSWRYESIIASKDAIIALYKEKLSGASPTEAKAKIDALQAQIDRLVAGRWPPLTNEQAQLIRSELKGLSHQRIVLMNDDADGRDLEKSFIVVFEELGWTTRQDRLAFGRAAEGITIFPKTVASAQLTEAMEKHTGFKVFLKQQGPPGDEDIHILIGPRPH